LFIEELKERGYKFGGLNIDLGCGNGKFFEIFKNFSNKLIGIDNSIRSLKFAKIRIFQKKFKNQNLNNIELILADMNKLPLRERSIDNIFSIVVIHLLKTHKQRKEIFSSIHKILKNNGYLLFTVGRRWQRKYRLSFIEDFIKRKLISSYRKNKVKEGLYQFGDIYLLSENKNIRYFYHFFSYKELYQYLEDFYIIELEKRGGPRGRDHFFIFAKKKTSKIIL